MQVHIKKTNPTATIPTKGSIGAAGYDLYACYAKDADEGKDEFLIPPKDCLTVGTGVAMEIPEGYVGLVYVRSGLGIKKGLMPRNAVGVIDCDYRGEIMVCLLNTSSEWVTIHKNERIAQIVLTPYLDAELTEVEDLSTTDRGAGGFGSTGK